MKQFPFSKEIFVKQLMKANWQVHVLLLAAPALFSRTTDLSSDVSDEVITQFPVNAAHTIPVLLYISFHLL